MLAKRWKRKNGLGRLAGVTAGGACGWARPRVGEEEAGGDGCYRDARLCVGLSRLPLGL